MPYTPSVYTAAGTQTYIQANNAETQYTEASASWEASLLTPFVLTGFVCTKDGSIANQLDVTQGTSYIKQTDSTLRRRTSNGAPGPFTTSVVSTTYYLDHNPDGTFSWGTAHSGQANYLPLCQVTTDSSGNILTVTDERTTLTSFLTALIGILNLPSTTQIGTVNPVLEGTHSNAGRPTVSVGNGAPASLAANEIYVQLT